MRSASPSIQLPSFSGGLRVLALAEAHRLAGRRWRTGSPRRPGARRCGRPARAWCPSSAPRCPRRCSCAARRRRSCGWPRSAVGLSRSAFSAPRRRKRQQRASDDQGSAASLRRRLRGSKRPRTSACSVKLAASRCGTPCRARRASGSPRRSAPRGRCAPASGRARRAGSSVVSARRGAPGAGLAHEHHVVVEEDLLAVARQRAAVGAHRDARLVGLGLHHARRDELGRVVVRVMHHLRRRQHALGGAVAVVGGGGEVVHQVVRVVAAQRGVRRPPRAPCGRARR